MDSSEDKNCSALQNVNAVFSFYSLHLASGKHALSTLKKKKQTSVIFRWLTVKESCSIGEYLQQEGLHRVPVPVDGHCLINAWHVLSNDRPSEPVSLVV